MAIWSGLGEWVASHITKGQKIVIAGRLKWRQYETAEGNKRQAVDITADSVIPVPSRRDPTPTDEEIAAGRDDLTIDDDIPF